MKGTDTFKQIINDHLLAKAADDSLFAQTLKKPKKNIDDCITYIINTVKSSGRNGFADEEIFGMAVHYYDEDDIKPGAKVANVRVVSNRIEEGKTTTSVKPVKKTAVNQHSSTQISLF